MDTPKQGADLIDALVTFASYWLIPSMLFLFAVAIVLRSLVYYTVKRQEWFAREFEKRVDTFLDERVPTSKVSFFIIAKRLLEKTYYELFRVRYHMKRRNPDLLLTMTDRFFLIQQGTAFFVRDLLKPLKHLKFNSANHPQLLSTTKKAFARNPSFSRVFGVCSGATLNDVINILPGVFIILGVFGTFLGIMNALPDLGNMDLEDIDASKAIMDQFLIKISFAMSTSLVGIVLSVVMSFMNAAMAPQKIFVSAVDRLEAALDCLWHLSSDNELPESIAKFDENRNPDEVLAEQALNEDLILGKRKTSSRAA